MLLKKLLAQLADKTDPFWKFYSPADTLWSSKNFRWVLGYTTVLTPKMSHDCVQYVLFARQMESAEKTKKLRPFRRKLVSSPVQQLCLSHIWRLASFTTFAYFSGHACGFAFVQNDYKQLEAICLFHWFDTHLLVLSQQISSLNYVQWLPRKCNTNTSKCDKMWVTFCLQSFVYTVLMMYTFRRSKLM